MRRYLSQGAEKKRSVGESTVPSISKIKKERNNLYVFYVYFYIYSFILFVILRGVYLDPIGRGKCETIKSILLCANENYWSFLDFSWAVRLCAGLSCGPVQSSSPWSSFARDPNFGILFFFFHPVFHSASNKTNKKKKKKHFLNH